MITVIILLAITGAAALMLVQQKPKVKSKELSDLLPLYKIEENYIISKKGDVTLSFQVVLPEVFTLSADDYTNLHQLWVKAIKVLPANVIVHKQDIYKKATYSAENTKEQSYLARSSDKYFHGRQFLGHETRIFITQIANNKSLSGYAASNLFNTSLLPKEILNTNAINEFIDKIGQFRKILEDGSQIKLTPIDADQLTGSDTKTGILEQYIFNSDVRPILKDISLKPHLAVATDKFKILTLSDVADLPDNCAPSTRYDRYSTDTTQFDIGFASSIGLLLDCNHIYNQYIVTQDTQLLYKKLEAKKLRLQSLSKYSRENAIARDATEEYLNESISQGRLPVKAHYNLMVWAADDEELKNNRNKASAALAQLGVVAKEESFGAATIWWSGLPGNEANLPDNELFDTFLEQACCFLANETNYKDTTSDFYLRFGDRISGKPVKFDPSETLMRSGVLGNRNKLVIGGSGSGKSMLMNFWTRCYVEANAHVVIIDVGGSYAGLCKLLNGYYFTYTTESPISFNPFYISPDDILDTEKKESIKSLILALWKKDTEVYTRSEYVALSNILQQYYDYLAANKEVFPCFNSFYEYVRDIYSDVLKADNVKDKDFDFSNFLYVLKPYHSGGEFDFLLNATSNLDLLNQKLVIFEIDNIKDHPILFGVLTLIIAELFISKMRKLRGVRKVIIIEEAWKAIASAGMSDFIRYLYKTIRKFFGEAIVVSQEINDIISSPVIKETIVVNADTKILLDMRKFRNKFDDIQRTLGLSNKAKMLLLSVNTSNSSDRRYREVFIDQGGTEMKVLSYEPCPQEYLVYSTEEKEKTKVQEYTKKYGSIEAGVEQILSETKQ